MPEIGTVTIFVRTGILDRSYDVEYGDSPDFAGPRRKYVHTPFPAGLLDAVPAWLVG
jgi:hypothetical protein